MGRSAVPYLLVTTLNSSSAIISPPHNIRSGSYVTGLSPDTPKSLDVNNAINIPHQPAINWFHIRLKPIRNTTPYQTLSLDFERLSSVIFSSFSVFRFSRVTSSQSSFDSSRTVYSVIIPPANLLFKVLFDTLFVPSVLITRFHSNF